MRLAKSQKRQSKMSVNYSEGTSLQDNEIEKGEVSENNEVGTFFGSTRPLISQEEIEEEANLKHTEKQGARGQKMVSFELEENIQGYLIYLLAVKQEDYEALTVKSKPWHVAVAIFLTQIIQCYTLTIMFIDTGLYGGVASYYTTDSIKYQVLRYMLLAFAWVLFLHEMNEAIAQYKIVTLGQVVKRERLNCLFFKYFQLSILLKCALCIYTLTIVIWVIITTHIGRSRGSGLILNYTAVLIINEFDNIAAKLYVKLWDRSQFKQFLEVQVNQNIFQYTRSFICCY